MPIGVCQTCGSTVRFEGAAGLCPSCGTVLRAGERAARTKPSPAAAAPESPLKNRRAKKDPVDLESLDLGEEEEFAPGESGTGRAPTDPIIFYLIVGSSAVLVVFGLYFALSTFLSRPTKPAIAPPPPISLNLPPPPPATVEPVSPAQPVPTPVGTRVVIAHPAPTTGPAWMSLKPSLPKPDENAITDDRVGIAITKAVAFLKTRFGDDALLSLKVDDSHSVGMDALAIYSLMHAGEAIDDPDLLVSSEFIQRLLNRLKQFAMTDDLPMYDRSLRASALAMFNRTVDQDQLSKDRNFLLKAAAYGAYYYTPINPKTPPESVNWDNSNSQYGLLGVWASAQTGMSVPDKYWADVEQHWLSCQNIDGGWGYSLNSPQTSTSMTAAGVTSLCVTAEQQELIASKGKHDARPQLTRAVARGIDWLGDENHLEDQGSNSGYNLYGIERAALATGFRFFGDHDWYRELGAREIAEQHEDGSWDQGDGDTGMTVETSFRILFLSRGRQPLLMNKLRFTGDWNDRPRDVAKITQFVSSQLEKPFAWGVADLNRDWKTWMESPVLFITTDAAADFSDQECVKLRAYTDAGGLIFIHNEYSSPEVDEFVAGLVKRVYPEYPMKKVAPGNLLYSAVYPIKKPLLLGAVGNGVRTFLVYSPKDITQDWVRYRPKDNAKDNASLQLAVNLTVVGEGKSDYRNRLDSPYEELATIPPNGALPVFQISYPGAWDPEPKAYERFSRWFEKQTSLKLDVKPMLLTGLDWQKSPIAVMTGTAAIDTRSIDTRHLHDFVNSGGVLFIDATGGNTIFADSVQGDFLPRVFPGASLSPMLPYHPIFAAGGLCMDALPKPKLRNYATSLLSGPVPDIQYANVGKGTIIFSSLDVTTGLLSSSTYAINGYTPAYCQSLMKNVILWALGRSKS